MNNANSSLSESLEDYLEVILELETANKVARTKDIAEKMSVQRGTVTGALKNLAEKGLINYEPYSFVTLTRKGSQIAKDVSHRHMVLRDFLFRVLQIDKQKANDTACRMEHAMDKASFEKLVQFIDFIDNCPKTGDDWIQSFVNYCSSDEHKWDNCDICIDKCRSNLNNPHARGGHNEA